MRFAARPPTSPPGTRETSSTGTLKIHSPRSRTPQNEPLFVGTGPLPRSLSVEDPPASLLLWPDTQDVHRAFIRHYGQEMPVQGEGHILNNRSRVGQVHRGKQDVVLVVP